ncbi:MAG: DUF1294 domain-containing protein [Candidatus Ornithospirochaeta sp.]
MNLPIVEIYLLSVNALGLLSGFIISQRRRKEYEGGREILPLIFSILGGAAGTAVGILVFNREADKNNMLSRVITFSLLMVQTTSYLIYRNLMVSPITFLFWRILTKYPVSMIYLVLINVLTFIFFSIDKKRAEKGKDRVKITTLLALSYFGGSIGALAAMYALRHKTQKPYFTIGVPLMLASQIFLLFFLSNTGL